MTATLLPFASLNPVDCNHNGTTQIQRLLGGHVCIKCMRCGLASITYGPQIRTMGGRVTDIALRYAEASFDAEDLAVRARAYIRLANSPDFPSVKVLDAYWQRRRGGKR